MTMATAHSRSIPRVVRLIPEPQVPGTGDAKKRVSPWVWVGVAAAVLIVAALLFSSSSERRGRSRTSVPRGHRRRSPRGRADRSAGSDPHHVVRFARRPGQPSGYARGSPGGGREADPRARHQSESRLRRRHCRLGSAAGQGAGRCRPDRIGCFSDPRRAGPSNRNGELRERLERGRRRYHRSGPGCGQRGRGWLRGEHHDLQGQAAGPSPQRGRPRAE